MKPVIFEPASIKELNKALKASRAPLKFQDEVDRASAMIAKHPEIAAIIGRGPARQYQLRRRLPYSLIYVEEVTEIVVYAVAHHKRRPGYWRRRLRKP